jgi:D-alanyl-D-alanine carboxypeptidase
MGISDIEFLNKLLDNIIKKNKIFSAVLCVESGDGRFSWKGATGDMQADNRYFIASVTKLYVTAVVMRLIEGKFLALEDKIEGFLPKEHAQGLHVLKGVDYTSQLTIKHLISNTSGLPDYFFHKRSDGKSAADLLLDGVDESWDFDKTINTVKKLKPKFQPGKKGKASYSDTNYQILGKIIESVTGKSISEVFRDYIFDPLHLKETYVYTSPDDQSSVPFYYKTKKLWLPKYMTSISAEGGIVSTAAECMIFLKAFFQGYFFPPEILEHLKQWNLILPPPGLFFYGIGLEKLWTPWFISPFKPISEILGFWGQTGSFAWYNPDTDLYFCGTTNQIDGSGHDAAGRAILKMIKKAW